jgi:hypothetical protein
MLLDTSNQHTYNSYYIKLSNSTTEWFSTDSQEAYLKNLNENYDLLKQNNWINSTIRYKFNSNGFRSEEFTQDSSIMFLGCSNTAGVGLPAENRFSDIVSKKIKLQCVNLGVPGSSYDTAFRLSYQWIPIINPKIVVFLQPPNLHCELILENKVVSLNLQWATASNAVGNYSTKHNDYLIDWTKNSENQSLNITKNLMAIKLLCHERNIKFISHPYIDLYESHIDLARDLRHPGKTSHQLFADNILNNLFRDRTWRYYINSI